MTDRTTRTLFSSLSPQTPLLLAEPDAAAWTLPATDEELLLLLCDRSGIVRALAGPEALLQRARRSGLAAGVDLREAAAGHNAVALALAAGSGEVRGEAHFLRALQPWSARAEAVPAEGAIVGYASAWWPATVSLVAAVVQRALRLAAAAVREQAARSEAALLLQLLEGAAEPVRGYLVVDTAGQMRLATPAAQRFLGVGPQHDLSLDLPFLWQQLQRARAGRPVDITLRPPAVPNACAVTARPLPGAEPGLMAVSVELLLSGARPQERAPTARFGFTEVITTAPAMLQAIGVARSAAATDTPILLLGESGTGKELVAQAIHFESPRRERPFIAVNCAAFPRDLIVSELFGYEEGAYTGARRQGAPGRFEQADGGTLFLDEVGEMAPEHQAMLLRVLEERTVTRLGGGRPRPVDVRIVAATNQDLRQMVEQGRFRADLFYRLHVIAVRLPPLRERPQDVALMVQAFTEREAHALGKRLRWTPEALQSMAGYSWPGNGRELYNVVKRAAILAAGDTLGLEALPWLDAESATAPPRRRLKAQDVAAALTAAEGNVAEAARRLGVARSTIYRLQQRE